MRGNEDKLGSPNEDMLSICSVDKVKTVKASNKFLVAIGWGIDAYHGVSHSLVLENIARLIDEDGYLGAFPLVKEMSEAQKYRELSEYAFKRGDDASIVASSILAAVVGHFGNYHSTPRTEDSELFINAFMSFYWCFRLKPVAEGVFYLPRIAQSKSFAEILSTIGSYRSALPAAQIRPHKQFPH